MADRHRVYRALVHLYPREFRREYRDDLLQHFADLVSDRGARAAWARTSLDLTITLPRYHLERIMNDHRGRITLNIVIALLAAAGIATLFVDVWLSPVVLVAAGVLAITQRSALAQALRVPDTNRRHRRLRVAAILAATFAASYVTFLLTVGDSWTITDTALAIVGNVALFGAGGFLIAGIATPRSTDPGPLASGS